MPGTFGLEAAMSDKGKIPEGWEVKRLEEIADVKTGPFGSALHANDYVKSGTPIITVEHLGEYSITRQNLPLVSNEDKQRLSAYVLQEGDVIFSRVGSVDRNAYVSKHEDGWLFSGRLLRIRSISEDFDTKYLGYYFKSESVKSEIRNIAVGQTMASLNTKLLNTFEIILPPLPEQHAIAEVLSDMDGCITSLEKLIAKKKAVKQGAIQELLTGRRRLPGFEGEWKEKTLSDFGYCVRGVSYNPARDLCPYEHNNSFVLLRANNISDEKIIYQNVQFVNKGVVADEQLLLENDIVIAMSSGSVTAIGKSAIFVKTSHRYCIGAFCAIFRSEQNKYIQFLFQSDLYRKMLMSVLEGTSINNLNGKIICGLTFMFPPTKDEQSAIATVLSDMDAEVAALTSKLNKAKFLKQGMMQELLTGRIRLVSTYPIQNEFGISEYMVILAIITKLFTDKRMKFLKHMRYQKLFYLYLVYKKAKTDIFEKWDYGPFSKELAYTVAPKAENEKLYIATDDSKNICIGKNINEAVENAINRGYYKGAEQLAGKIRYKKDTELEVLATVIESIRDLEISQKAISLQTIKEYIGSIPIWKPKLSLEYFTDLAIDKSMKEYYGFFK
ncbi:MAG: restriction endonuclease subunit S [Prevotella sp.]|jgi:type I restriction enzyme S subunit|nr:restriction endonuclease subunit S [Prevotella sp.]